MTASKPLTFVIVEDNKLDVEKIERGMKRLKITNPILTARDGLEALDLLRGTDGKRALAKPYVLLMDLNMPRMNGFELLAELRSDDELANTPVFVLTTSDRTADVEGAYAYNIAGYIVKPLDRDGMLAALGKLDACWELSQLPKNGTTDSR